MELYSPLPGAIEVQGLTKLFGERAALNGLNLRVARGECLAIFGPNGAGKTTLIKILAMVMKPSSGAVLINGKDTKSSPEEVRRDIGVVSHQTYLYGSLTAYENLDFYSRMYDIPRRSERIREVVEMVGMTARINDRVNTLSRGMQQRVSIARCLLHKPSTILLDEPETGLDQQAIGMLWQALRAEGEERRTIIYTTHSLERGLELCDRVLILVRGRIRYEGVRQELNLTGLREVYQNCTGARGSV